MPISFCRKKSLNFLSTQVIKNMLPKYVGALIVSLKASIMLLKELLNIR